MIMPTVMYRTGIRTEIYVIGIKNHFKWMDNKSNIMLKIMLDEEELLGGREDGKTKIPKR